VIKNGLVGASMVGFEGQLTDKEIWSLSSISETPPVNMGLAWWDIERKGTYDGMRWSYGRHGWADGSRSVVKATPAAETGGKRSSKWVRSSENLELRTLNRCPAHTSRESRSSRLSSTVRRFAVNLHESCGLWGIVRPGRARQ
jgi:hypothetical protein